MTYVVKRQENPAIEHNREAWEEIADSHSTTRLQEVARNLAANPTFYLEEPLRRAFDAAGIDGAKIVQFNCNNGRELISALNYGAERGYGFDISTGYIEQARSLAREYEVDAAFYVTDVTDIDPGFNDTADIVFATASALCWIPHLSKYFSAAYRVLSRQGTLILYETHPAAEMLKTDVERSANEELVPYYKYNTRTPVVFKSEGEYFGDGNTNSTYWYHHSLSYIIQSALDADFKLYQFEEYEHDVCVGYKDVEQFDVQPPLSMLLRFSRE